MNPDDYDEDGNNIVPCPICGDVHCPSKEDGKCPEEDAFVKWHEDVETVAEVVYDFMVYDEAGEKPKWVPHGNSLKQDEARAQARAIINALKEKENENRNQNT